MMPRRKFVVTLHFTEQGTMPDATWLRVALTDMMRRAIELQTFERGSNSARVVEIDVVDDQNR